MFARIKQKRKNARFNRALVSETTIALGEIDPTMSFMDAAAPAVILPSSFASDVAMKAKMRLGGLSSIVSSGEAQAVSDVLEGYNVQETPVKTRLVDAPQSLIDHVSGGGAEAAERGASTPVRPYMNNKFDL